jgi:hypothetical protein
MKPHIKKHSITSFWICWVRKAESARYGLGKTPMEAYLKWKSLNLLNET